MARLAGLLLLITGILHYVGPRPEHVEAALPAC